VEVYSACAKSGKVMSISANRMSAEPGYHATDEGYAQLIIEHEKVGICATSRTTFRPMHVINQAGKATRYQCFNLEMLKKNKGRMRLRVRTSSPCERSRHMVDRDQGGMREDSRDHSRKSVHENRDGHSCVE